MALHIPDSNQLPHNVEDPKLPHHEQVLVYRVYRRRFAGLIAFVLFSFVSAMPWAWFGPISNDTSEDFSISITQVNWLGNITSFIFIPVSLFVPVFCTRFGIRRCAEVGAASLLISAWIRYSGTVQSLSSSSAYALLILGQLFAAISQPIFQVLGPKYSETWFDLKSRTTATMIIAISNPIGGAVGQLLSPIVGSTRQSILVLGIMSTAVTPFLFLISNAPPTPPTYAGSKAPQSLHSLVRAMAGKIIPGDDAYMIPHERLDFAIISLIFGVMVGATNALSVLSAQYFEPQGYNDVTSGLFGATLLLSGIVTSIITAPLFDRVLTHHLGITLKVLVPIVAGAWLSLIWAVKPDNTGGLFVIMVIIGTCSVSMLPVTLELGVELTRNADGSSAIMWCSGNAFGVIFILAEGALRAPATASPPYNMRSAIVLHSVFVMVFSALIFFIRAKQARREMDERMAQHPHLTSPAHMQVGDVPMDKMGSSTVHNSLGSMEKEELIQVKNPSTLERDDLIPPLEGIRAEVEEVEIIKLSDS